MKNYKTGDKVNQGYYLSVKKMDLKKVSEDNQILQGKDGGEYMNIPAWLLVTTTPILGGLFVILFPVMLVTAMCVAPLYYFVRLVIRIVFGAGEQFRVLSDSLKNFSFDPAAAHFSKDSKEGEKTPKELKSLESEVNQKKNEES